MKHLPFVVLFTAVLSFAVSGGSVSASELASEVELDYQRHLGVLFEDLHQHPELSFQETRTAKRMAAELRDAGFEVTEAVGGTGVVAILRNGAGPMVMMRADMDGLPVEEKTGLAIASTVTQTGPEETVVPVMHACGHDVHMASLVGTARVMAASKEHWSGTLMLLGQPAEEIASGAKAMKAERLWERFGTPDYALAFHVAAEQPTGTLSAVLGSPSSGSDSVDITIHGVGTHGASPHEGIDPIVLGSQIVLALQTLVSRELPPREAGVVTVGSFHAGTKHNIVPDVAHLQLTVRNDNFETRELLLAGIKRISANLARAAGLPEDKLPQVRVTNGSPPNMNDIKLTSRLRTAWSASFGQEVFQDVHRKSMYGEDFAFLATDPYIPSTYFSVGGTLQADIDRAMNGGAPIAPHHSPLFKIEPEESIRFGVEATVFALRELLQLPSAVGSE